MIKIVEDGLINALDITEQNGLVAEYEAIWVVLSTLGKQVSLMAHKDAYALALFTEESAPWDEALKGITIH